MGGMAIRRALPTPWSGQSDHTLHLAVAAYAALRRGRGRRHRHAAAWFWMPLAIAAVAGVGVLAFRHTIAALRRLAADRRRHAGDDAGRPRRPRRVPGHDRGGEGGGAGPGAAVHPALRALARRVQSRPRVPGDVRRRAGAWPAPRSDAWPTACARCSARWRRLPSRSAGCRPTGAAPWSARRPGSRWSPWLRRRGARRSPACVRCSSTAAASGWPGWAHPAFLAGFCLAAIYACLIELYREGRSRWLVLLAVEFPDPGADRRARAARLCRGGDRPDPGLRALRERSRAVAASCPCCWRPACCRCLAVLASRAVVGAAVLRAEQRGRQSQRAGSAVAAVRAGGRGVALVRLGCGRRQRHHPAGQRAGAADQDLGGAQRISAHVGGGRTARPRPADRAVRAVGGAAHARCCAAPTG